MTKNMIIGYGQIGRAIEGIIGGDVDIVDPALKRVPRATVDIMHVCFPYSRDFVKELQGYIKSYKPKHVVIYSTVPIGITKGFPRTVHSPVEGKHPDLEMSLRLSERWIGYNDLDEAFFFTNFFQDLGLRVRPVENSDFTEALKLLSTTEYGINIEFARYKKIVASELGMDYELTKRWNEEYNKLYKNLGLEKRFQKFVLDAPEGPKGGHCIVPNAKLLQEQFPDELVAIVGELE